MRFKITNGRLDERSNGIVDVIIDGVLLYEGVSYQTAEEFCVRYMRDDDCYQEDDFPDKTGKERRDSFNYIQRRFIGMGLERQLMHPPTEEDLVALGNMLSTARAKAQY